jgi:hypothetical protein
VISVAVISGLFGIWCWMVLNDDTSIAAPVNGLLQKNRYTLKFMRCPFCSGAWFAIIPSLILLRHDPLDVALITAFAAAGITGLLGSYFGD